MPAALAAAAAAAKALGAAPGVLQLGTLQIREAQLPVGGGLMSVSETSARQGSVFQ